MAKHEEDDIQTAVAQYLDCLPSQTTAPRLIWWHTPNGGRRNPREGARLRLMGVKKGVPDIFIAEPPPRRPEFKGTFIELKAGKNRATVDQTATLDRLRECGYFCTVCTGIDAAVDIIQALGYAERNGTHGE